MGQRRAAPTVELYRWNPRRPVANRWLLRHVRTPVNNFGDLLGPVVVCGLHRREGLGEARRSAQLLSVGSVLHAARSGAVVWGSGANGKIDIARIPRTLDVRAVRGPHTAAVLRAGGHEVPDVFGDPVLLLAEIRPDLVGLPPRHDVTVVPNLNDVPAYRGTRVVHPRWPLALVLRRIATSRLVVGSSLHAIIVADALGVPARLIRSQHEEPFKYLDHYAATGRPGFTIADSVAHARELGGEAPPEFDPAPLLRAFPRDLWHPGG